MSLPIHQPSSDPPLRTTAAAQTLTVPATAGTQLNDLVVPETDCTSLRWVSIQLYGTWTATIAWEISNGGDTWIACPLSSAAGAIASAVTATGLYCGTVPGKLFRGRISAYTSGNVEALSLFSTLDGSISENPGNSAASPTGSAVPANADYEGINVGGTLRGWTGANPSGTIYAGQVDLASVAGTTAATGGVNGSVGVGGLAAANANLAGNPILVGGSDGTKVQNLLLESASNPNLFVGVRNGANQMPAGDAAARGVFVRPTDGTVTFTAGSKTSANSFPVVVASDQGAVAVGVVSGTALVADQTNTELRTSTYVKKTTAGDTALTLGSATSANSVPVVVASDQGPVQIQATDGTNKYVPAGNKTILASTNITSGSTITGTAVTGLGLYRDIHVMLNMSAFPTATSIDVYLQTSSDNGTTWRDIAHSNYTGTATRFAQISGYAAGATAIQAASDAALAGETVVQGPWGDQLRIKIVVTAYVSGTGTFIATATLK